MSTSESLSVSQVTDANSARHVYEVVYKDSLRDLANLLARDSGLPPSAAVAGFREHFLANRAALDVATHNVLARTQPFIAGDPLTD